MPSPTTILMPLTQTQTSLPLSNSDLLVLKNWVFETALGFLLFGVHVTLSIVVLCVFVAQDSRLPKSRLALSLVTIMMLAFSLSSLVMNIEFAITQIPLNGYNPPDIGGTISLTNRLEISGSFMERLNYVLGDVVVVWRAWVLFPRRLPVKVTLSICLLGSFVGAFLEFGLISKGVLEKIGGTGTKTDFMILTIPLIFTNFTATALIGFQAWHHFQSVRGNLGSTNGSRNKVLKILLLLIESGSLYLAFWLGYLILGSKQSKATASETYAAMMLELVAIYPILIILAVAHENNKPESVHNMSLSQSIRFASVRASKSEDHHSESGGQSQPAGIDNSTEVEGNEIEIVPRSG
ncbi:hypothetical protein K435DRAFT_861358 [Dendrothele bispora CBS 962.96]|uniref:Family A G protein-coupled receptor-like protein n=1 Tax=Dendrothele bispora (strain CBS 962.96) TaxID=1314807 RepID=A0A4S8LWP3_DENBC|nr:hypothetical protein K435DRAFT_861358 [Dendrothele bispora CBS 962.96]